jgi:hypothetical protein
MTSMAKVASTGVLLVALSGAAAAQGTPATRQCQAGEQLIGGACQPLTRVPNSRSGGSDDSGGSGNTTGGTTGGNTGGAGAGPGGASPGGAGGGTGGSSGGAGGGSGAGGG